MLFVININEIMNMINFKISMIADICGHYGCGNTCLGELDTEEIAKEEGEEDQ